ncbi:MAG TPA: sigma-70 family RNA polymerase sigma factor [Vicinamibacterales bacterium]|nr:sigma-70 family RNA polymerase sigma factor [Vicinamibacterales bacterium]
MERPEAIAAAASLRAGDPQAFEQLVRRDMPRLLSVARRVLKNDDDAREAVQQAFIAAYKARDQFEGNAQPSTWLHRITVNKAIDILRARQRRHEDSIDDLLPRFLPNGHWSEHFTVWPEPAEDQIDRKRLAATVREAIDHLPESHRLVLLLRDIEELSTEETATAIGITPNAVKLRLHRARMALRTLLADRIGSGDAATTEVPQ